MEDLDEGIKEALKMTSLTPEALEALAIKLKEVSERGDDASDSENSIGEAQTNRYNKLKRKARFVSKGQLTSVGGIKTDTRTSYFGNKKRATISSKMNKELSSDEEDAYHDVALEAILAPISEPYEVISHPAHRVTFRRQTLPLLAAHALQTISTEHEHRVQLSRLLTAFLGDDPSLVMDKFESEVAGTSLQTPVGLAANNLTEDGTVPVKAMTRNKAAAEESMAIAGDFITPGYDRNLGIPPDEAEEARRLLQAALDRSEEYLRCMQKVRSGLVKADRYVPYSNIERTNADLSSGIGNGRIDGAKIPWRSMNATAHDITLAHILPQLWSLSLSDSRWFFQRLSRRQSVEVRSPSVVLSHSYHRRAGSRG